MGVLRSGNTGSLLRMKVAAYLSTMWFGNQLSFLRIRLISLSLNPNWGEYPDSATTSSHLFKKVAKFVLLRISRTV